MDDEVRLNAAYSLNIPLAGTSPNPRNIHTRLLRAHDVLMIIIADKEDVPGFHAHKLQERMEHEGMRLPPAHLVRNQNPFEVLI